MWESVGSWRPNACAHTPFTHHSLSDGVLRHHYHVGVSFLVYCLHRAWRRVRLWDRSEAGEDVRLFRKKVKKYVNSIFTCLSINIPVCLSTCQYHYIHTEKLTKLLLLHFVNSYCVYLNFRGIFPVFLFLYEERKHTFFFPPIPAEPTQNE